MTEQAQEIQQLEPYVKNLDEMVGYQEGSIVSKMIADKKTGNVTMFAFGEGQGVSEQALPFDSVLFITDGEMEITLCAEDDPEIIGKNEMVYIPAGVSHSVYGTSSFKMFSIMIRQ